MFWVEEVLFASRRTPKEEPLLSVVLLLLKRRRTPKEEPLLSVVFLVLLKQEAKKSGSSFGILLKHTIFWGLPLWCSLLEESRESLWCSLLEEPQEPLWCSLSCFERKNRSAVRFSKNPKNRSSLVFVFLLWKKEPFLKHTGLCGFIRTRCVSEHQRRAVLKHTLWGSSVSQKKKNSRTARLERTILLASSSETHGFLKEDTESLQSSTHSLTRPKNPKNPKNPKKHQNGSSGLPLAVLGVLLCFRSEHQNKKKQQGFWNESPSSKTPSGSWGSSVFQKKKNTRTKQQGFSKNPKNP